MKAAFTYWHSRIAPVFDSAKDFFLVEVKYGAIVSECWSSFAGQTNAAKITWLIEMGIDELICGAVSRQLESLLQSQGIAVRAFIAGELRDVVEAWAAGRLDDASLSMPGCCGRRSRRRGDLGCRRRADVSEGRFRDFTQ